MWGGSSQALFKTNSQSMSSTKLSIKVSSELRVTKCFLLQSEGGEDARETKKYMSLMEGISFVFHVYEDIELPLLDAKVAGCLCMEGPAEYVMKRNSGAENILSYSM